MDEVLAALTRSWLAKAEHDLRSARIVATATDGPLDTAIYHCQQGAEKAIKTYLVFRELPFEKTHDIVRMLQLAEPTEARFAQFFEAARLLTPLAWQFRYPSDLTVEEPTRTQFDEALQHAQAIYDFVLTILPSEILR